MTSFFSSKLNPRLFPVTIFFKIYSETFFIPNIFDNKSKIFSIPIDFWDRKVKLWCLVFVEFSIWVRIFAFGYSVLRLMCFMNLGWCIVVGMFDLVFGKVDFKQEGDSYHKYNYKYKFEN